MRNSYRLLLLIPLLFASVDVTARPLGKDAIDMSSIDSARSAVVRPGTHLAAGNLAQNEFYILDHAPVPVARADIKVAVKHSLHTASTHRKSSKIVKIALKAKKHRIAKK